MPQKPIIIGNWKMNGSVQHLTAFIESLIAQLKNQPGASKVVKAICPPAIYLPKLVALVQQHSLDLQCGAQDVSGYQAGAYTGQISADMLKALGCQLVIVGHSERRQYNHETDEEVANKFIAAKEAGLVPILCVGETKDQYEQNLTDQVIESQLSILLNKDVGLFDYAMIAYEPIWAIGTGLSATPQQAGRVHALLRRAIARYDQGLASALPILYGGSVKPNNAQSLLSTPDIDGVLVGGASFMADDFSAIVEAAVNSMTEGAPS